MPTADFKNKGQVFWQSAEMKEVYYNGSLIWSKANVVTGPPPITKYRYWRMVVKNDLSGGGAVRIPTLRFRQELFASEVMSGGTPFSSNGNTSYPPDRAFDEIYSNFWMGNSANPTDIGYDFGVGVSVDINQVFMDRTREPSFAPTDVDMEASDDGVTWTLIWSGTFTWESTKVNGLLTRPTLQDIGQLRVRSHKQAVILGSPTNRVSLDKHKTFALMGPPQNRLTVDKHRTFCIIRTQ